jgi:hypothetical protein
MVVNIIEPNHDDQIPILKHVFNVKHIKVSVLKVAWTSL